MHPQLITRLIFGMLLFLGLSIEVTGQTHRSAQIVIRNSTGELVKYVRVLHKYTDQLSLTYKNDGEFFYIPAGSLTNNNLVVDYNTGAFTTGSDWWSVVWITDRVPSDGRADFHYRVAKGDPRKDEVCLSCRETISQEINKWVALLSDAGISDFKQHELKTDDENRVTVIELRADGQIAFISPSGVSTTESRKRALINDKLIDAINPPSDLLKASDDIIWQHHSGQVHSNGLDIYSPVGSDWSLKGVGDVDGDGTDDIIWQHNSGQTHYWKMQNGQRTNALDIYSPVGSDWSLKGVGDVDGDGTDDIIWQNNSGQVHYWKMQNGQRTNYLDIYIPVGSNYSLKGVGDIDGDGTDDIIWQHNSGQVHYWKIQNGQRTNASDISSPVNSDWSLKGIGDVDGDGTDDIIWQHDSGYLHYWPMKDGKRIDGIDISSPIRSDWSLRGVGHVDSK